MAEGQRIVDARTTFRKHTSGQITDYRYQDAAFRIFGNDALQKYRAQFNLAARYAYLAAKAYDYETSLAGTDNAAGQRFLTDIVRQRHLGQIVNGLPVSGRTGLADPLARMGQNFEVYRGQLGFNNPQTETSRFSLRSELFRIKPSAPGSEAADVAWRDELRRHLVTDLWQVPEFRSFCRSLAPESAGPQPALVLDFPTTVTFRLNYFGWDLAAGDSSYDPSLFATKIRSAGVWFSDYDTAGLANTPRVFLVPVGMDILRTPNGDNSDIRTWSVVDQKLPVPFPIGLGDATSLNWIPQNDELSDAFGEIRRHSSFRAYHDAGFVESQMTLDSRLIGRSVWNTRWVLIIPGGTLLFDADRGLNNFINSVSDIKIFFQTYAYSGN